MLRFLAQAAEDTTAKLAYEFATSSKGRILASVGAAIAIGLNITPIVLFIELCSKRKTVKEVPEMMFITGTFCSLTNLAYAIIIEDPNMTISNAVCTSIQLVWASCFLWFYTQGNFGKWFLFVLLALISAAAVLGACSYGLLMLVGKAMADTIVGWFNLIIGVINAGSPGQKILTVMRTGNYNLIPIVTAIFQCACSTIWFFYGLGILNYKTWLPNLLGIVLSGLQVLAFFYNFILYRGKEFKQEEEEGKELKNKDDKFIENKGGDNEA